MQMRFTCSDFHAPMCQGLLVFIYRVSYGRERARNASHTWWRIRGQNNLKYTRRAAPRVGVVRLWHYFGAGTCSDVGGNQVIACIDRIGRLHARGWRGRRRRRQRRRQRKDTPRAGYIGRHQNAGCYFEVNSGTSRDTSAR